MKKNNINTIIHKMNEFGFKREPFLFIIDFYCKESVILPLSSAASAGILYNFNQKSNITITGNKRNLAQTFHKVSQVIQIYF